MQRLDVMELLASIRRVNACLHRRNQMLVRGTPLKGYHILHILQLCDGRPRTGKQLNDELAVDKGHTSRVVNDLLELGYVRRVTDGRRAALTLTEKGISIAEMVRTALEPVDCEMKQRFSAEDYETFMRVLLTLGDILDPAADRTEAAE